MKKRDWTMKELNLLSELYPNTRTRELVRVFNRSMASIDGQAIRQGLKKKKVWTEENIKSLKNDYPKISTYDLADRYGTSVRAVNQMAYKLGIKKKNKSDGKKRIGI